MIDEAMETAITLVTPENFMCNGKMEQTTTGNVIPSYSLSPSRSDKKVQSRYLKPSMASCHDNCKYGKKHDYEAASQNFRTFRKKNVVREREKKQEATPNGEERRMRTVTKPRMETESKPENDFSAKLDFSKAKTPTLTKKSITPAEKKILVTSRGNKRNQEKSLNLDDENKTEEVERRTPLQPQSSDKPNVINLTNLSHDSEADALQNPGSAMENTESTVSEPISSVASTEIKQKSPPSVEKPQTIKKKAPLPLRRVNVTARSAILLKARAPLMRSISHLNSSRSHIARRNQEKKATKSFGPLKSGSIASKPLNSLKTKAPVLRTISARRSQEKIGEGAARPANAFKMKILPVRSASQLKPSVNARGNRESRINKNLHTTNIAARKVLKPLPASFSPKAPLEVVSSFKFGELRNVKTKHKVGGANAKTSEATDLDRNDKVEDSETVTNELRKEDVSKVENKRGSRSSSAARPEDNTSTPYKLKFRQGKVMDLHRCDSYGARRLWFRVGKAAGENPDDHNLAWRRSFRKKRDASGSDSNIPNSEAQSVVLKHQEAEKRKDAQALLNHVIEETASKLVDVRKSKVKALVGAFETVMSRQ
ncbi:uncharacterized protein M6B38_397145 [Iris pallida]|uniref:Calmodulin-binding domain-containing protein n=1 Tax=Iris pallida TaxID=29817 RepID=A0AAX6FVQ3_IRIPA|nr:uncharacterized protein M6B38_397145 [Iris pallida]